MAKSKLTLEDILNALAERLLEQEARIAALEGGEGAEEAEAEETAEGETEEAGEAEEGEAEEAETTEGEEDTEIPSPEEVEELDKDDLIALAEQVGLEAKGKKEKVLKALLVTVAKVANDADEYEEDELQNLAEALEIEVGANDTAEEVLEAIQKHFAGEESEAEEATEEEADTVDGEAEETAEGEAEGAEEEAAEAPDYAAIVKKKGKYPDEKTMRSQLEAFNKAASKEEKITIMKGKLKEAYGKLLQRLVDHEGNIAKWGKPYIREDAGFCCGLELEAIKKKGDKREWGRCLVTKKEYYLDEENDFVSE